MRDAQLLTNPEANKFADVHRLPQHPTFKSGGGKATRQYY